MKITQEITIRLTDGTDDEPSQLLINTNPPPGDMIDLATILLMMNRAQTDLIQQAAHALEEAENILQLNKVHDKS